MKKSELTRTLAFLLLVLVLLTAATLVFQRKTACDYTTRVRGFYNSAQDSYDVIFFGSSHTYCTVSPLVLYDETGIKSYVLATQQQPVAASYYYMKESLKTQHPKLMVVEIYMADNLPEDGGDAVFRDALDPMKWSRNKVDLIKALVPAGERSSYYFDLLKYHSRWSELSQKDFDFSYMDSTDAFRGYIYLTPARGAAVQQVDCSDAQPVELPEENIRWYTAMKELAEDNGAELVFFISPYEGAINDTSFLKALHNLAEDLDVPLLDFNQVLDEVGFDGETDFFDTTHLNVAGSELATRYMGNWLKQLYIFDLLPETDSSWSADYKNVYEK